MKLCCGRLDQIVSVSIFFHRKRIHIIDYHLICMYIGPCMYMKMQLYDEIDKGVWILS